MPHIAHLLRVGIFMKCHAFLSFFTNLHCRSQFSPKSKFRFSSSASGPHPPPAPRVSAGCSHCPYLSSKPSSQQNQSPPLLLKTKSHPYGGHCVT